MIIAFDNGISGGIAAISAHRGSFIAAIPMPIQRARKGNQVNVREVFKWLSKVTGGNLSNASYFIEEPGGSKSSKAAVSMAGSFHALRALLDVKFLRWQPITPRQWQKVLLPGADGDTKPRALELARRLWPDEQWLATPRCKTPHDGMIDAALIAEFGRREKL